MSDTLTAKLSRLDETNGCHRFRNPDELEAIAEIARLTAEVERLQVIVEAARAECEKHNRATDVMLTPMTNAEAWTARQILRALDGEP